MAIEFMDNFSQYGTDETNMLDGVYAAVGSGSALSTDPDGVSSGKVIYISNVGIRKVLSSTQTTVGVAFRLWIPALPDAGDAQVPAFLEFLDGAAARQVVVRIETTGILSVRRGTHGGTQLAATAVPVITAAGWYHIEMKVVFDQTAGEIELRVNGVPKIEETGLDTCNTTNVECSQVRFGCYDNLGFNNADSYYIKDLIIWNGTGTSNNDFMGDCQVVTLLPTGDDDFNWAASTGTTGYNLIDETDPNDADYISADATPPDASVFTLTDLDPEVVTVKGLMTFCRALKTDGGTANMQVSLVSGASEDNGSDTPVTVAATYWTDISEVDPATAAAYTPIAVNALKLKIDRTT